MTFSPYALPLRIRSAGNNERHALAGLFHYLAKLDQYARIEFATGINRNSRGARTAMCSL